MFRNRTILRPLILLALCACIVMGSSPALAKKPIVFADLGWDTVQVHNRIAAFIFEKGMDYPVDFIQGETIMLNKALIMQRGSTAPNVNMETWTENWQELYDEGLAKGKDSKTSEGFIELGSNFPNSVQGWYVPTYVIKGDKERGIKPMAPELKSVSDLPKYWELFKDPEDPKKGRFYTCIPGWSCAMVNEKKFEAYGLNETYNIMQPGSGPALAASIEAAHKRGKPWVGYYWEPTWVMGKLDMFQLEEPAFNPVTWDDTKGCGYPSVKCDIIVHKDLTKWAPDVVGMLLNYETTLSMNNEFLAYMRNNDASKEDTAAWWLKEYESLWSTWVTKDVAAKVKKALK